MVCKIRVITRTKMKPLASIRIIYHIFFVFPYIGFQVFPNWSSFISNTEKAVERGVFGIPTFFIDDEIYFGKDTIWMIEEILAKT